MGWLHDNTAPNILCRGMKKCFSKRTSTAFYDAGTKLALPKSFIWFHDESEPPGCHGGGREEEIQRQQVVAWWRL
ncbi:MAG TPA: hypothetical protein DCY74_05965 [Clostridiales bacterium]|nr:hypothetical protein [Clostridiales bacterium]